MTSDDEYITVDEASGRLGKTASQVRRDVQAGKLHFIKQSGRIWVRVDERFLAMQENPRTSLPPMDGSGVRSLVPARDAMAVRAELVAELIDEVRDLSVQVASLRARIQMLEANRAGNAGR